VVADPLAGVDQTHEGVGDASRVQDVGVDLKAVVCQIRDQRRVFVREAVAALPSRLCGTLAWTPVAFSRGAAYVAGARDCRSVLPAAHSKLAGTVVLLAGPPQHHGLTSSILPTNADSPSKAWPSSS
jgi:hypothetical protein